MDFIDTTATIDGPFGCLDDCPAVFNASTGYEYDDWQTGAVKGWYCLSAELYSLNVGGSNLDRDEAVKAFGRAEIERIETLMPDIIARELNEGKICLGVAAE
jgi:hypothetical protein